MASQLTELVPLRTLLTGSFIAAVLWTAYKLVLYPLYFSPYRHLPCPGRGHLLYGQQAETARDCDGVPQKRWVEQYGSDVIRYFLSFGQERLAISDPKALHHILVSKEHDFCKSELLRAQVLQAIGPGLVMADGESHRRQRRILSPAFVQARMAGMAPAMIEKTQILRDQWTRLIEASGNQTAIVNAEGYMSKLTLDVMGTAGLDYEFGALSDKAMDNPLLRAFAQMGAARAIKKWYTVPLAALTRSYPVLLKLPVESNRRSAEAYQAMRKAGMKIIEDKRAKDPEGQDSDLLTAMLKANESEGKHGMSMEETFGQLTTFIFAGHETTSSAIAASLYELSRLPAVQKKLRAELRGIGIDDLTFERVNALPYLDAVIRETLRLHSPATSVNREARIDQVIPLSTPLANGWTSLPVRAGQPIAITVLAVNTSKKIWGPDADSFRPERWFEQDKTNAAQHETSSYVQWGSQLTFLGGPRSCIGFRMALAELKISLALLVPVFEFSSGLQEGEELYKRSPTVRRMFVRGKESQGALLPLRIRFAQAD